MIGMDAHTPERLRRISKVRFAERPEVARLLPGTENGCDYHARVVPDNGAINSAAFLLGHLTKNRGVIKRALQLLCEPDQVQHRTTTGALAERVRAGNCDDLSQPRRSGTVIYKPA